MGSNMASAASLNGFRTKLVACIDDLRKKREDLNEKIRQDETLKIEIENKIPKLSMELSRSSDKLDRLSASLKEIDFASRRLRTATRGSQRPRGDTRRCVNVRRPIWRRRQQRGLKQGFARVDAQRYRRILCCVGVALVVARGRIQCSRRRGCCSASTGTCTCSCAAGRNAMRCSACGVWCS